jgi:hypothetical protein
MSRRINVIAQHPARFALGEIIDHPSPGLAGGGACFRLGRPLHDRQNRRLRGSTLALASPPEVRTIGALAWAGADVEFVHLDRAVELMLAADQQPQHVSHPPGGRLADPNGISQAHRRNSLVRLQHEP